MLTKIVESEHGQGRGNHGKFMLCRFDADEWSRESRLTTLPYPMNLLGGICGWGRESTWVLDLQTGEGALFRPGGYAHADLDKHAVWVCPLFEPFLEYAWQWVKDGHELWDLPDVVQLPDAPFALAGYRRPGPSVLVRLPELTDEEAEILDEALMLAVDEIDGLGGDWASDPRRTLIGHSLRTAIAEARTAARTAARVS